MNIYPYFSKMRITILNFPPWNIWCKDSYSLTNDVVHVTLRALNFRGIRYDVVAFDLLRGIVPVGPVPSKDELFCL